MGISLVPNPRIRAESGDLDMVARSSAAQRLESKVRMVQLEAGARQRHITTLGATCSFPAAISLALGGGVGSERRGSRNLHLPYFQEKGRELTAGKGLISVALPAHHFPVAN